MPPLPAEPPAPVAAPPYPAHHHEIEKRLLASREWKVVREALEDMKREGAVLRMRAHQHAVEIACEAGELEEVQVRLRPCLTP